MMLGATERIFITLRQHINTTMHEDLNQQGGDPTIKNTQNTKGLGFVVLEIFFPSMVSALSCCHGKQSSEQTWP